MPWSVRAAPVVVLLLATLAASPAANAEAERGTVLRLAGALEFGNATLLSGALSFEPADVSAPVIVNARALAPPGGDVVACPRQGEGAQAPPVVGELAGPCRGAVVHANARLSFGAGTGLLVRGSFTVSRFPNASLSVLLPSEGAVTWAAVLPAGGLDLAPAGGSVVVEPTGRAASTTLRSGQEVAYYNGTEWYFLLPGEGTLGLTADGLVAVAGGVLDVRLERADEAALRSALRPRALLELQEALVGRDAREPVRNLTALVGDFFRVPHLLNAAVLGHLNGTAEGTPLDPARVSLVRVDALRGSLERGVLTGAAAPRFTVSEAGFAPPGEEPRGAPWAWGVGVWATAAAALALVPAGPRAPRSPRLASLAWRALALVAWDSLVRRALGTSAGSLIVARAEWGPVLDLIVFEAVAFAIAWLLFVVPVRLVLERSLGHFFPRALVAARPVAAVTVLVVAALAPWSLLGLGFAVARL